ncbi:unnamed protein product [Schistosoma margrebowiei]|uniref:Uncharacterized protein n=1 Tax=Schistosoma margrebowiei TaxID=48269 RepID=A0A183LKX6_9TREM|nr:unnamed protein product [Schistosoma margrebowiei]
MEIHGIRHQIFVISYARLLAAQLSIQVPQSCFSSSTSSSNFFTHLNYGSTELVNYLQEVFINYIPPMFTPSNKHIVIDENEMKPQQTTTSTSPSKLSLPKDNDPTITSMKKIIFNNPSLNDGDNDLTIKEICLNESFLKMCTNILESLNSSGIDNGAFQLIYDSSFECSCIGIEVVERVDRFTYLRSLISPCGLVCDEISAQIQKARLAFANLHHL